MTKSPRNLHRVGVRFWDRFGDSGDSVDFYNMAAANDSSEEVDGCNRDSDPEGQGAQELGGAKAAAAKKAKKDKPAQEACCKFKTAQLQLEQRKIALVTSMVYLVTPDGNHRDKKSAWRHYKHIYGEVCKLRGQFNYHDIGKGYKLPVLQDMTKDLVFATERMCTHLDGQTIDVETWKVVALSHFLSNPLHLHLKTKEEVLAHPNCPNANNISAKLFHHTQQLLGYVRHFDELLKISCPTEATGEATPGKKGGEREGGALGRQELKEAKIAAQPGMQMANSMKTMGKSLSLTFEKSNEQTITSREKVAAGLLYHKELVRQEDKIRRLKQEWENVKNSKLAHKLAMIVQMDKMYSDVTKRELQIAKVVAEMDFIESEQMPPEMLESSPSDKVFLDSLKATFEAKQPVPVAHVVLPVGNVEVDAGMGAADGVVVVDVAD